MTASLGGLSRLSRTYARSAPAKCERRHKGRLSELRAAVYRALRGGEPLGDLAPVDDVPDRVEVVGALVLVLEVVRVLPDIDPEQWRLAVGDRVVLVRRADDGEAVAVLDQPRPAGAELADAGLLDLGLEVV